MGAEKKLVIGWDQRGVGHLVADGIHRHDFKFRTCFQHDDVAGLVDRVNPVADKQGGRPGIAFGTLFGQALFPEQSPATRADLMDRFGKFLSRVSDGASDEKLRVVPAEDTNT